MVRNSHQRA